MKLETIFLRAARILHNEPYYSFANAINHSATTVNELYAARNMFQRFYPEMTDLAYWWEKEGVRILALLFAAEIAKDLENEPLSVR
ncbi:MAG: hypothetical protein IPM06_17675 [Rhizobiales bacterium]|nr:hypothetical protein [Hyphomicrobiales bacterium]